MTQLLAEAAGLRQQLAAAREDAALAAARDKAAREQGAAAARGRLQQAQGARAAQAQAGRPPCLRRCRSPFIS